MSLPADERQGALLKNTFILALGQFLPHVVSFVTLPIYTGMLTKAEYGLYDLINVVVYVLNIVVIVQIHQAVFRYLIDVRGTSLADKYITNAYLFESVPSIVSAIVFGACFYSQPAINRALIGLYLFLVMQNNVSGQVARGLGKNGVYAFGAITCSVSNLILVVFLVARIKLGFTGLLISLNVSYGLATLYQLFACKQLRFIDFKLVDKDTIKEMLAYSWPMVPNTLSIWVVNTCDKFIIRGFLGLEFNGIFAAAQKIPNIFTLAYSTFNLAWQESASISIKDKDYNKYYNDVFSALFDFLTGSLLLLIAASPILFRILIRGDYALAYDQMPLLYLGVFLSSLSSYFGSIYIAKKATKAVGVSSAVGAVINAVVNLAMVRWAGLYAASISTIASYLTLVLYRAIDIEKKEFAHIHYDFKHIAGCLFLIVLCSVLCYLKLLVLNWVNLCIGLVGFFVLNRTMIKQSWKSVARRLRGN